MKARAFVQKMKRKYGARPLWVWELLTDQYNIIKGCGWTMTEEEQETIEELVKTGLEEREE